MSFLDCAFVEIGIDPWGKRACASAIADAACEPVTDKAAALLDQNPIRTQLQPPESLLMFHVVLCPPGGELRIIANDFALRKGLDSEQVDTQ